ncbi:MAG TPA: AzlD domain-containing protein [Candidatus Competibacter sp.]|nr:AzlD domain-containing protein [Paracoccaceae bacterium]HPE73228.1 AzlD domain-containing protein [Candidatus Competibacter sp.]
MPDVFSAWGAILLASMLTLATRLSGPVVMAWLPMSPRIERFLQNLSLSVLAALVATMLARGGLREAAAVAIAVLVMMLLRKSIWAMGAGMICAASWTFWIG